MSTFSKEIWLTVQRLEAYVYGDYMDNFIFLGYFFFHFGAFVDFLVHNFMILIKNVHICCPNCLWTRFAGSVLFSCVLKSIVCRKEKKTSTCWSWHDSQEVAIAIVKVNTKSPLITYKWGFHYYAVGLMTCLQERLGKWIKYVNNRI